LTIGDTVITEKGIADKNRFYLPKNLVNRFDGHTLWFNIQRKKHITHIEISRNPVN
jgi:hypothetical protein